MIFFSNLFCVLLSVWFSLHYFACWWTDPDPGGL